MGIQYLAPWLRHPRGPKARRQPVLQGVSASRVSASQALMSLEKQQTVQMPEQRQKQSGRRMCGRKRWSLPQASGDPSQRRGIHN